MTVPQPATSPHAKAKNESPEDRESPGLSPTWAWVFVVFCVLLGAWLRFDRLDLMEYKYDESEMYRLATLQATGHFQTAGLVSGVGVRDPAVAVYLFALMRFVSSEPIALVYLPVALGVLAIPLCYLMVRESFGLLAALTAALLVATAPWSVMYSRKIWIQDLIPCFTTLAMWSAFRLIRTRAAVYAAAFAVLTSVMVQVHYSALALVLIGIILMAWVRRRRVYAGWAVGIAIGLMGFVPFLVHEMRHDFEDVRNVFRVAGGPPVPRAGFARTVYHLSNMTSHAWFREYVVGERSQRAYDASVIRWQGTPYVMAAIFAAGVLIVLIKARRRSACQLLLLWLVLPPILWSLVPDAAHYQIIALPAPFITIGVLVEFLWPADRQRRALRLAVFCTAVIVLILASAAHVLFFRSLLNFIEKNGGAEGDYGVPYRHLDLAAGHLARHGRGRTIDGAVFTGHPIVLIRLAERLGGGAWIGPGRKVLPDTFFILQRADAPSEARPRGYGQGMRYHVDPFYFDVWLRDTAAGQGRPL